MINNKKILVLGHTGFIGQNLISKLDNTKYKIYFCSKSSGIDMRNYNKISQQIRKIKPDIIFNVASKGGSLHYVKEFAADVINDNIQMALNLIQYYMSDFVHEEEDTELSNLLASQVVSLDKDRKELLQFVVTKFGIGNMGDVK